MGGSAFCELCGIGAGKMGHTLLLLFSLRIIALVNKGSHVIVNRFQ